MYDERIIWCQENIEAKSPEVWRDIDVPNTRIVSINTSPPLISPKMTVKEWATVLCNNKMLGIYRAYTDRQRIVAIIITNHLVYNWEIKDIGK